MADPIPPLTDEEIDQLAIDIITNRVFFPWTQSDMESAFMMVLAFATEDQIPPNATIMYEELSKAGPRSLNGMPMFTSGKLFPSESREALMTALERKADALGLPKNPEA